MSRPPLFIIAGDTKYVEDTERPPVCSGGSGKACSFSDGHLHVCLSKTGVPMAEHRYWPNEYAAQRVTQAVGKEPVISLIRRTGRFELIETLIEAMGQSLKEA